MKKYFLITIMILAIIVPMNQSCTNLDEEVFAELTQESFPKSPEQIIALVGAAYTSLYNFGSHNSFVSANTIAGDEMMIPQRGSDWFDGGQWLRMHRHEYNANEESFNNGWNTLYGGIANCNRIIATLEDLVSSGQTDASVAAAFVGELKALRALFYYWLLDMYGNVPVVTGFADAPANPSTMDRADVYAFVRDELIAASADLPQENSSATYGRMNYYAAQALLAKLYLNAEVYSGTSAWTECIAACDNIINSGAGFALEADYFTNFNENNGSSLETIFAIPFDADKAKGFNWPQMTLHYQSQKTFNMAEQPWNGYCSLQEFYNSYDDTDLRKGEYGNAAVRGNFIAGPQFAANGDRLEDTQDDGDPDGLPITFTPEINEHSPNCYRQAGVRVGKFEYVNGNTRDMSNDFPILRYGDILLTKAEAIYRNGGSASEALMLVNMVRQRAGVPDFTDLNDDNLLAERGRELFYENWRRGDLIRFGKYNDEWDFKPVDPSDHVNIFPIPSNQINANPNLTQNAGY